MGEDLNDRTALTPLHFLSPNTKTGTTLIQNDSSIADPTYLPAKISSKETLFNTWKKGQNLLEAFWKIWRQLSNESMREITDKFEITMS